MKLLLLIALLIAGAQAANWAVLVAGSNGYGNYRHQSDICHAFHILTDLGKVPADHIITFMYDDIAQNPSNPFKGNLINKPNGTNYYPGTNKDYTGAKTTADNFIYAITGDPKAQGPILKSGPDDNVFMYYSDHGGSGLVAFPVGGYLYADRLNAALKTMNDRHMYKKLVFYLEACESGSMFEKILPANINIFATTASTATQSSYACYYDKSRNAYLGDEYSVRWMEDSDEHNTPTGAWSLEDQFKITCKETTMSQPQQYGDMNMQTEDITVYQSTFHKAEIQNYAQNYIPCFGASSRDVNVAVLQHKLEDAMNDEEKLAAAQALQHELAVRARADWTAKEIVSHVVGVSQKDAILNKHMTPQNFDCLRGAVDGVENACGKFTDYSLKWVYTLTNMCESGKSAQSIASAAARVCN